jgi:hypothetical protein
MQQVIEQVFSPSAELSFISYESTPFWVLQDKLMVEVNEYFDQSKLKPMTEMVEYLLQRLHTFKASEISAAEQQILIKHFLLVQSLDLEKQLRLQQEDLEETLQLILSKRNEIHPSYIHATINLYITAVCAELVQKFWFVVPLPAFHLSRSAFEFYNSKAGAFEDLYCNPASLEQIPLFNFYQEAPERRMITPEFSRRLLSEIQSFEKEYVFTGDNSYNLELFKGKLRSNCNKQTILFVQYAS